MYFFLYSGHAFNKKLGGIYMDNTFTNSLEGLEYAPLSKEQENRLRELEKQFNNEFGTSFYLMAMDRDGKYRNTDV